MVCPGLQLIQQFPQKGLSKYGKPPFYNRFKISGGRASFSFVSLLGQVIFCIRQPCAGNGTAGKHSFFEILFIVTLNVNCAFKKRSMLIFIAILSKSFYQMLYYSHTDINRGLQSNSAISIKVNLAINRLSPQ